MDGLKKIVKSICSLNRFEIVMFLIMVGIAVYYAIQPTEDTPQWLAIINFISGVCGVICVLLTAKANRMNFPFAVINTTAFMIYLFYFGIWATFFLELIIYFPMNIISWYKWYQHKDDDNELLAKSKKLTILQNIIVISAILAIDIIVHYLLKEIAGNSWMRFAENFGWNIIAMQWLDSTVFAIGIVAVILEMLRYTEQYLWWIITDIVAVAQYAIKRDPVYTTKKAIYLIVAIGGLKNWNELAKKNKENE